MAHQRAWLADQSDVKVAEKGRRTGFTFAEALDDTLIAMKKPSEGGDTTYYIGDTKDKGREFVATCAKFALVIAKELVDVEEFVFDDLQPDGSTRGIQAFRVRFASGFEVVGLSGTPANIRGLQGRVVIDEHAFHRNPKATLDAVMALLIWGGKIRVISTHNRVDSAFNDLVRDIMAGRYEGFSLHRATFDDAVANGLYERMCLRNGLTPTPEGKAAWYRKIRGAYGPNVEAMREELDAIPREGDGVMLSLASIEAAADDACVVKRWVPPAEGFVDWPEAQRRAHMLDWLEREVGPILAGWQAEWGSTALGGDFAMRQDRSSFTFGFTAADLRRIARLIVELRQCPYDQQKQALFWIVERLPRFSGGILDANGNGMVLAQEARQRFGEIIEELIATDAWYREHSPRFQAAFDDRMILIPVDRDTRDDLRQLRMIGGVGKVPRNVRTEGTDGGKRHADNAVSLLNFHAATSKEEVVFDYRSAAGPRVQLEAERAANWMRPPADRDEPRGAAGLTPAARDLRGSTW